MIQKLIALFFLIFGGLVYASPIHESAWKPAILDALHPDRFLALTFQNNSPLITYFDARDEGGVLFQKAKSTGNPYLDDINLYLNWGKRDWDGGTADNTKFTGMFLAGTSDQAKNYLAYQEATLGREKLMYAESSDGKTWQKEIADDGKNGSGTGMYASIAKLKDQTIIFYHTESGFKFGYAVKPSTFDPANGKSAGKTTSGVTRRGSPDGEGIKSNAVWQTKTLETGVGLLTSTSSCNGKVYVAYRGRDSNQVYLATLSPSLSSTDLPAQAGNRALTTDNLTWSSQKLPIRTSTSLALVAVSTDNRQLTTDNCHPYLAYFDDKNLQVKFLDVTTGAVTTVDRGVNARISLAVNKDGFHLAYPAADHSGMMYAKSPDGKIWQPALISKDPKDDTYNSIAVDDRGNIYLAYISGNTLKYMEYNISAASAVKSLRKWSSSILIGLGLLVVLFELLKKRILLPAYKEDKKKGKR